MSKLWSSRFSASTSNIMDDFNTSLHFDRRMYAEDITGSIAHAQMLAHCGIIPPDDAQKIVDGLKELLADIESGAAELTPDNEDIHMNIEVLLTRRIGDAGKRLHTARSRNDQVALDLRMYLRNQAAEIKTLLANLIQALCDSARKHVNTVMPGYTHLQRAQPTTFAHHIMAYAEMLTRDLSRLDDWAVRMNRSPLGSGAMGATTYPIDRHMTARALGFEGVTRNSIDGVSDRDFVIELVSALSIIMVHLSRFAEEMILWCSSEFGFITLSDEYSTGSSIMPQKKNPDACELIRGKTGRVFGDLMGILTVMKGTPLAYNKDMQEDKEGVFDAADTVAACLTVFTPMFKTMTINVEKLRTAAATGFINATDAADYLVTKGVPFRDAYAASGKLVRRCIELNETLETLPLEEYKAAHPQYDDGVYAAIDLLTCVRRRKVIGGPAPEAVLHHIETVESLL